MIKTIVITQNAWLPVLRTLGTRPWFEGRLLVSRAQHFFNESGEMVEEAACKQHRDFLIRFIEFVQTSRKLQSQSWNNEFSSATFPR